MRARNCHKYTHKAQNAKRINASTHKRAPPHLLRRLPLEQPRVVNDLCPRRHAREAEAAAVAVRVGRICDVDQRALAARHAPQGELQPRLAAAGVAAGDERRGRRAAGRRAVVGRGVEEDGARLAEVADVVD